MVYGALYVAIGLCIWTLADPLVFRRDKLLSLMVLLVILITPIGSNNETYPNMNNLFLVAPVTFWMGYRLLLKLRRLPYSFACRAMLVCVAVVFSDTEHGLWRACGFSGQHRGTKAGYPGCKLQKSFPVQKRIGQMQSSCRMLWIITQSMRMNWRKTAGF